MIKLSALNDESEEESGSEVEVTKEALEQIALQQYAKALELQRKGNLKDATQLLKDLLDTELLYDVKKPAPGEKVAGPLFNLKYLSYKNLACMLSAGDDVDGAIEAYCVAAELDDTDVTLWHRLGQICMRGKRYEMALHAFQRGAERNPRHWPCLDKIVTLLLGLNYKEECIITIYDTLQLDPGYLRGLAYRKHIYTTFPYIKDYMEYLNSKYKWDEKEDEEYEEHRAEKLIKEANDIYATYLEQQKLEEFNSKLPDLKLKKPITDLTWYSVGESLVHMHHYMAENYYSHACYLEPVFEKETKEPPVEVTDEPKEIEIVEIKEKDDKESNTDTEKTPENESENENNNLSDKDQKATDIEKVESDAEVPPESAIELAPEPKKKAPVRRRGSDLSFLQQWEWCNKRRSGRKKPVKLQDDDNIYDMLRRMVPTFLSPEAVQKKENSERASSPDIDGLKKLFDEKPKTDTNKIEDYFNTENEQKDVKQFINKYTENKRDIIDMLKEFLEILSENWRITWPEGLSKTYIEANKCYMNHVDIPTCCDENTDELIHYCNVNILAEEFSVNEKSNNMDEKQSHELVVIEAIGITLYLKPNIFPFASFIELLLRQLWVKFHINMINKQEELALDNLYQILDEIEQMEDPESFNLKIHNFTFKSDVNKTEVNTYIKFLERNKKLSTVMDLYDRGNYEEVLSIVLDSFEHCKSMAKNQEEEMSLEFAVQLSLILDTYWALGNVDSCFQWSLICLHEALKHYFRLTTTSPEYDKWTLTTVKILCCMEHILTTEGLSCLDTVSQKDLSQGLEDLIRIIGHQVETNATDMPLGTVTPWIVMHYILQREEDQGRRRTEKDKESEDIPNSLLLLFIAHEQLGIRGWCNKSEGKLLFFILDTVVPRLRSPALSRCLEQVCQYMEQCVYCLYGHPGRKNKLKHLVDHNVTPHELNWERAQQVYEIFKPQELPALEGKLSGITADTEQLFRRILTLMPSELDPAKHVPEVERYIKGVEEKLPAVPILMPYKMRDIYFLLGDYYFKKEEGKMGVKFNILDVVVNNDRLESWAEISLAKAVNLERILNSCKNLNNEREFLNPAKSIIRCFKRALQLDPTHCNMWIEYGMFVYTVHSFCSRLLKQASESLSMEDFESLEKQKEDMLDTTQKCFMTVLNDLNNSTDGEKDNEDSWLHYYMLGKVAEKRSKPPAVYLDYYLKGVKSLQETDATYPLKINYNSPTHLCIEVLELHYRIHASILKYIEQHENKPISTSVGKVFMNSIEEWKNSPFCKKSRKENIETESQPKPEETGVVQAANILKRSISDAGEEETHEAKRLKLESAAAKVRRSASYDTERQAPKDTAVENPETNKDISPTQEATVEEKKEDVSPPKITPQRPQGGGSIELLKQCEEKMDTTEKTEEKKDISEGEKKQESSSSSSSSSSETSSSDSSSDSTSDSSRDSAASNNSNDNKPLSDDELMKIISACLDSLEDCASRFPPHYKAIYRVAHYHFYYKKGKDIERCRDLLLSNFTSRSSQKLGGLFSERKHSNFFNNIWKIPLVEVDRAGGFAFHMSRSVLLTMEILKEIDDHKTLLDLSMQLQRFPEPDKKYLRDSDREELAQQAFSLCVQSLKGQLLKFSQQADLKSNDVEQQALKSLMLDIYRAYQRAQKQPNSKQFTNLLIDAFKLVTNDPIAENMNLVDLSMKYCQKLIQQLKYEATLASLDKSQNAMQKKQATKQVEAPKPTTTAGFTITTQKKSETTKSTSTSTSSSTALPKMSAHEMAAAFQSYLPMLNDPMLSQQTAAALSLSYLSNISALAGYSSLQNSLQASLQNSLQNSFQAEFYRQFLGQSLSSYLPPPAKKQKRGPKPGTVYQVKPQAQQTKPSTSKSFASTSTKATSTVSSLQKPSSIVSNLQKAGSSVSSLQKASSAVSALQKASSSVSSLQKASSSVSSLQKASSIVSNLQKGSSTVSNLQKASSTVSNLQKASSTVSNLQKSTSTPAVSSLQKSSTSLAPSMGTVLPTLPASLTANLSSYVTSHSSLSIPSQAHVSTASTVNAAIHTKPPMPHQQVSPGKTLQEKLAERQKHHPITKNPEISASISKLPSSLTITKTSVKGSQPKKPEAKKALPFSNERPKPITSERPKPITSDEVIVLDDD